METTSTVPIVNHALEAAHTHTTAGSAEEPTTREQNNRERKKSGHFVVASRLWYNARTVADGAADVVCARDALLHYVPRDVPRRSQSLDAQLAAMSLTTRKETDRRTHGLNTQQRQQQTGTRHTQGSA